MKFHPSIGCLSTLAVTFVTNLSTVKGQTPVQTYFIPLPEEDLHLEGFRKISTGAKPPINSFTSIAVAAKKTVIWYDHWEDGYDFQVTTPSQNSTQIWGDGNCDNGFAPNINGVPNTCETPEDDILLAGNAISLDNDVPIPRDSSVILFDGGDRVQASFPIAMTRGSFPRTPGPFLGGALEVVDIESWGTTYVTPVGRNTVSGTDAFTWCVLFVMASKDGTVVTLHNGETKMLRKGENLAVPRASEGYTITATEPVQVDLISGDRESTFEMRWYSLTPRTAWGTEYYSPVGTTSEADTVAWLYNPGPSRIDITYTFAGGETGTITDIRANDAVKSPSIPDGSGARFTSSEVFYGLTQTEATSGGENFDWGHPLIPGNKLTSQALVGWGYGCADNECEREGVEFSVSRSVVFVTPVADAVIKVDFDNDGVIDQTIPDVEAMESLKIVAPNDDMTGALVFATTTVESDDTVDIAVAWGQDPARSGLGDSGGLDLGTSVPPLPLLDAGKSSVLIDDVDGNGFVTPGDVLQYTIRVANIGQVNLGAGAFNIIDNGLPLFDSVRYKEGSTTYSVFNRNNQLLETKVIPDDSNGTPFPLDESGIASVDRILRRGGSHEVKFEAEILPVEELPPEIFTVTNTGFITLSGEDEPVDEFSDSTGFYVFGTPTLAVCAGGDGCGPLLSQSGTTGSLCASVKEDNLEVDITVTEPGCQLWETHLCNLPYLSDEGLKVTSHTVVVPKDEAYDFVCGFEEDFYLVAGHATLVCDDGTGGDPVFKNTHFGVELCCDHVYPPGFQPPPGYKGPYGGPGTEPEPEPEPETPGDDPTPAPVQTCAYECIARANPVDPNVCPESFDDCVCRTGFKKAEDGSEVCVDDCGAFTCPPGSEPNRDCVRFMRDCTCDAGLTAVGTECISPA